MLGGWGPLSTLQPSKSSRPEPLLRAATIVRVNLMSLVYLMVALFGAPQALFIPWRNDKHTHGFAIFVMVLSVTFLGKR